VSEVSWACPPGACTPPTKGRQRLLEAAEPLLATRGLDVPDRVIIAAAGHRNKSAIPYHFGSRAGLIHAIWHQHAAPIAQHRSHLIFTLPARGDRTTRQVTEAYIEPFTAEMHRSAPSYYARFTEKLLADQPLWFTRDPRGCAPVQPANPARAVTAQLFDLTVGHLAHLSEFEAVTRVALTIRFLIRSAAQWERDTEAGVDLIPPLPTFRLILTDLAVAMFDAPRSLPPQVDVQLGYARTQT
jgi:AcrR family transcriptional regulator